MDNSQAQISAIDNLKKITEELKERLDKNGTPSYQELELNKKVMIMTTYLLENVKSEENNIKFETYPPSEEELRKKEEKIFKKIKQNKSEN